MVYQTTGVPIVILLYHGTLFSMARYHINSECCDNAEVLTNWFVSFQTESWLPDLDLVLRLFECVEVELIVD